ncbi:MAG: hypothetical protein JWM16_6351 [Verrucomicrobiales bacterium]|nr:hypothetical protein [Verrucomicrobiales bacterium]
MAVSGSTDFKSVSAEIIADALSLLGVLAEEEPLPAYDLVRGMRFLTKMLKQWEGLGIGSWLRTEGTFALVASTPSYVFGSGGSFTTVPFDITDARITRSSIDLPMERLTREEYFALPNKTTTGYPTQYFYDRQRDNGTLYVWPSPDTTAGTFGFTYRRRIMDIDAATDNFDLPPEWEKAITDNLAYELIAVYGKAGSEEAKKVSRDAPISFAIVQNFDVGESEGSIMISPDRG